MFRKHRSRSSSPAGSGRVVIVGGGIGGLATACDLARQGFSVRVLERGPAVGGKLREVEVDGRRLDAGPTVLTMRHVFDALFADAGAALDAYVSLRPADVLARHTWSDGSRLDLYADRARSADAIAALAGPAEGRRFLDFCDYAARIHAAVEQPFIHGRRPGWSTLLRTPGALAGLRAIDAGRTMWQALGDWFHDPRLRQLFGRYATYCGSSPFAAPATLNVIAHVEQAGVWRVDGGMYRLAEALTALAQTLDVDIRCGAEVQALEVRAGRVAAARLATGEVVEGDAFVCNAGVGALAGGLLGEGVRRAVPPPDERSLSAVTWTLVAEAEGFPLAHHNVFFSDDYPEEFRALAAGRVPATPTVYVCAQDRHDVWPPPAGAERLLCLINAPAVPGALEETDTCETRTFAWLNRCGLTLRHPRAVRTTPADFARLFPGTAGALYGAPTHGRTATFRRPGAATRLPNLFLCGGEVHPGAGVPMAALSGRRAAEQVSEALRSTSWWRRAATPGGTSTSSIPRDAAG